MFNTCKTDYSYLLKIRKRTENFFYGNFYPVILTLLSFLFWFANIGLTGFTVLIFIGCFVLIVYDDMTPTIPLLLELPMVMRNTSVFMNDIFPFLLILPVVFAFLIKFILYPWKKPTFDKLSFAFLGIILTSLLGGIFSPYLSEYLSGIYFFLLTGVCAFAIHFVFGNRIKCPKNVNLGNYFCYCFIWAINLACAQRIYIHAHVKITGSIIMALPTSCWANSNHVANLILLAVPLLFYLLINANRVVPYLLNIVYCYVCLWLTGSDGCISILIAFTPFLLFAVVKRLSVNNYKKVLNLIFIILAVAVIFVCAVALFYPQTIIDFINRLLNANGRTTIYAIGLGMFIENPVFGVGIGHAYIENLAKYGSYFHSTLMQVGATTGVVGLISYGFLYYYRAEKLLKNNTDLGFFAFTGLVMFFIYALVDNGDFNVVLIYLTLMITVLGKAIENQKGSQRLPLSIKYNSIIFYNQFCK